jgi:hypothetical protein
MSANGRRAIWGLLFLSVFLTIVLLPEDGYSGENDGGEVYVCQIDRPSNLPKICEGEDVCGCAKLLAKRVRQQGDVLADELKEVEKHCCGAVSQSHCKARDDWEGLDARLDSLVATLKKCEPVVSKEGDSFTIDNSAVKKEKDVLGLATFCHGAEATNLHAWIASNDTCNNVKNLSSTILRKMDGAKTQVKGPTIKEGKSMKELWSDEVSQEHLPKCATNHYPWMRQPQSYIKPLFETYKMMESFESALSCGKHLAENGPPEPQSEAPSSPSEDEDPTKPEAEPPVEEVFAPEDKAAAQPSGADSRRHAYQGPVDGGKKGGTSDKPPEAKEDSRRKSPYNAAEGGKSSQSAAQEAPKAEGEGKFDWLFWGILGAIVFAVLAGGLFYFSGANQRQKRKRPYATRGGQNPRGESKSSSKPDRSSRDIEDLSDIVEVVKGRLTDLEKRKFGSRELDAMQQVAQKVKLLQTRIEAFEGDLGALRAKASQEIKSLSGHVGRLGRERSESEEFLRNQLESLRLGRGSQGWLTEYIKNNRNPLADTARGVKEATDILTLI